MSPVRQKKVYHWIIGALVLLNLASLIGHWLPHRPPPPIPPTEVLAHILNLDQEQVQAFEELNQAHRQQVQAIFQELHPLKDSLLRSTGQNQFSEPEAERLSQKIGNLHAKLDQCIYLHLRELRSLCRDNQINQFDRMIQKVLKQRKPPFLGGPPLP